jgi:predicted RNA-binding Zn-ribbon protein involved in translation (DUF1610 family)
MTRRKIICWNDGTEFEVEINVATNEVLTPSKKLIFICPKCGKENKITIIEENEIGI